MAHETSSWHAEIDLRVFAHLHRAPGGRADITPTEALGVRLNEGSVAEVVTRIHHMLEAGWIDGGEKTIAGVRDAALAPCVHAAFESGAKRGGMLRDAIIQAIEDDNAGRFVEPERFVALRDEAVFYC